jgi:hypothetical protein
VTVAQKFFFSAETLEGKEGEGHHREGDVVVPALPAASLVMVEAKLIFQLLVALLDPPADLRHPHQTCQISGGGKRGEPVPAWLGLTGKPLDEQPLRRLALLSVPVAVRRPHPQRREAAGHGTLRPFAPGNGAPTFLGEAQGELVRAERCWHLLGNTTWATQRPLAAWGRLLRLRCFRPNCC